MGTLWMERGRRSTATVLLGAMLMAAVSAPAAAASGGMQRFSPPIDADLPFPSGDPEMAQRQALGCSFVGLGVTGVAVASGALAAAGSGGTGAVPIGAAISEIITYFGAGCAIGAFLAGLFPVSRPAAGDVGG